MNGNNTIYRMCHDNQMILLPFLVSTIVLGYRNDFCRTVVSNVVNGCLSKVKTVLNSFTTTITDTYNDFYSLNMFIAKKNKDRTAIGVFWISTCIVAKMYRMRFVSWINDSIVHIDKRRAAVTYILNGKPYKIIIRHTKGPCHVLSIHDEIGQDVTLDVVPYMGPNHDWHGHDYTPAFWNRKSLSFHVNDGRTLTFQHNESINV